MLKKAALPQGSISWARKAATWFLRVDASFLPPHRVVKLTDLTAYSDFQLSSGTLGSWRTSDAIAQLPSASYISVPNASTRESGFSPLGQLPRFCLQVFTVLKDF